MDGLFFIASIKNIDLYFLIPSKTGSKRRKSPGAPKRSFRRSRTSRGDFKMPCKGWLGTHGPKLAGENHQKQPEQLDGSNRNHDLGDFNPTWTCPDLWIWDIYGYLGLALMGILARFKLPTKMGSKWKDPTTRQQDAWWGLGNGMFFSVQWRFFLCTLAAFFFARYTLRSSNVAKLPVARWFFLLGGHRTKGTHVIAMFDERRVPSGYVNS